jgi:hypothetical protein
VNIEARTSIKIKLAKNIANEETTRFSKIDSLRKKSEVKGNPI